MAPLRLRVLPVAKLHIDEACVYYASQADEHLVKKLLREINEAFDQISSFPLSCPIFHRKTRRKLLGVFPYWVYYRIEDGTVLVYALFHAHRSEKFLKRSAQ